MLTALYGVPIGAIVLSLIVIKNADRQRAGVSVFQRLTDAISAIFDAGSRLFMPRRKVTP